MSIKVIGIQRTGTNYLAHLMGNNIIPAQHPTRNIGTDPAWKHAPVSRLASGEAKTLRDTANHKLVIIIKNPYTWYTSITDYLKDTGHRNYDGLGGYSPEIVFKRYNSLYEDHRSFLLGNNKDTYFNDGILVRYEDLILSPQTEIKQIAEKFGASLRDEFKDLAIVPMSTKFTEARRSYYLAQKPTYSQSIVDEFVDWELMKFYGYNKIGE